MKEWKKAAHRFNLYGTPLIKCLNKRAFSYDAMRCDDHLCSVQNVSTLFNCTFPHSLDFSPTN